MENVDVLDGWQTLDVEVAQPPEMETLAHHGVEAAVENFFLISTVAGAIREVLDSAHARALT
jgi:hypothetical protein